MKKITKQAKTDPADFDAEESKLVALAAQLAAIDHDEAAAAYDRLGVRTYAYARAVIRSDLEMALANYLCRRDRSVAVFKKSAFELAIQLAFPGKFPLLNSQMQRGLGLKLSYAMSKETKPKELIAFFATLPPAKTMKGELAPDASSQANATTSVRRPAPSSKRPIKRKPKPHRLKNSPSHKAMKAAAKASRKPIATDAS